MSITPEETPYRATGIFNDIADMAEYMKYTGGTTEPIGNIGITKKIMERQADALGTLEEMTNTIDNRFFKPLANDMVSILKAFYMDETIICCVVKNLLMTVGFSAQIEDVKNTAYARRIELEEQGITITENAVSFEMSQTSFVQYIDLTVAVIDVVLSFIEEDIRDFVWPNLDFLQKISEEAAGFLIISLQEILYTIRDTGFAYIIDELDKAKLKNDDNWLKCMPFVDLIEVLKRYIHDYGMTDQLMKLINSMIGQWFMKFKKRLVINDIGKNLRLIELLKSIRRALLAIRDATLSWALCIFNGLPTPKSTDEGSNIYSDWVNDILNGTSSSTTDHNRPDFKYADDNTILLNGSDNGNDNGQNSFRVPSNDEVKAFMTEYLGFSDEKSDEMLASAGDRRDGTTTGNSCGEILDVNDLHSILNDVISKSKMG